MKIWQQFNFGDKKQFDLWQIVKSYLSTGVEILNPVAFDFAAASQIITVELLFRKIIQEVLIWSNYGICPIHFNVFCVEHFDIEFTWRPLQ